MIEQPDIDFHTGTDFMHFGLANILMACGNLENARQEYLLALQLYISPPRELSNLPAWVTRAKSNVNIIDNEIMSHFST